MWTTYPESSKSCIRIHCSYTFEFLSPRSVAFLLFSMYSGRPRTLGTSYLLSVAATMSLFLSLQWHSRASRMSFVQVTSSLVRFNVCLAYLSWLSIYAVTDEFLGLSLQCHAVIIISTILLEALKQSYNWLSLDLFKRSPFIRISTAILKPCG